MGTLAAGAITSVLHFRNARGYSTNEFSKRDAISYRPGNATGVADYVRYLADLTPSTGALAVDANVADTTIGTENHYIIYDGLHPRQIVNAMQAAQRLVYSQNIEPLSMKPSGTALADAGMQGGTGEWVESDADSGPAVTIAAVTTANSNLVYSGVGSLSLTNAAVNGYFRKRYDVVPGETYIWHSLSRWNSGTGIDVIMFDLTGSAAIGTKITHTHPAWHWAQRKEIIPADCVTLETRHANQGASDVSHWNASSVLSPNHNRVDLDTKWDSAFKMPTLMYAPLGGISQTSGLYPALSSSDFKPVPVDDYRFLFERVGANPYAVVFKNDSQHKWFNHPLYINGRRAHSDFDTAPTLALTQTTSADLDLFTWTVLKVLFEQNKGLPDAEEKLLEANQKVDGLKGQFVMEGPADPAPRRVVSAGLAP